MSKKFEFVEVGDDKPQVETPSKDMKKNFYALVLDASGSMFGVRQVTKKGVNEQIETIKKLATDFKDQEYYVTLITFSSPDKINVVYFNKPVGKVSALTDEDYITEGGTALYDAVGEAIEKLSKEVDDHKDEDIQVVLQIFTDGEENSSTKYSGAKITSLIEDLQGSKKWIATYIGANHDVAAAAKNLGIAAGNTVQYSGSAASVDNTMKYMSMRSMNYAANRSKGIVGASYMADVDAMTHIDDDTIQTDEIKEDILNKSLNSSNKSKKGKKI